MRTRVTSFIVPALCAAYLLTTSCKRPDPLPADARDASTTDAPSSAPSRDEVARADAAATPSPLPATDTWDEIKVAQAKVRLRIPKGASVPANRTGREPTFAGSYFRVLMPSGYDVYFAERHGSSAVEISSEKLAYRSKPKGKVSFLFEAEDALVVHREDPAPAGSNCGVTACGNAGGKPICIVSEGVHIEGTQVTKLTEAECFALVSIARSIRDL